ncbi:uncharacterized protein LOC132284865 isoform X2 [Cornus florida]|uniref:uncharacterized protein LOC132284865 isoform X2 n=1 Tax=Cornus florida TaxID=4283 RepID=UPI0028A25DB6|nr:uncharacterized protein LOC132284865 isoform X2 [Cornus florida]
MEMEMETERRERERERQRLANMGTQRTEKEMERERERERERLANMGTQRTEMEMEIERREREMERREREVLLATIGTKRRQKITHRPNERIGPNQCLMITELPMSLMCDSCGNRMPKCSKIAVIQDASIIGQERVGCSSWTKMHYDCTNPNCIAEITVKRKGYEIVVVSGATSYFRPEDEKLEYFPKTISYRSSRGARRVGT